MSKSGANIPGALHVAFGAFMIGCIGGLYGSMAGAVIGNGDEWAMIEFAITGWVITFLVDIYLMVTYPKEHFTPPYVRDGVLLGLLIQTIWRHLWHFLSRGRFYPTMGILGIV